ncbi:hypothetical protein HaLaN_04281 [Haematococcus lacustris]|uniref:Uncharacterized protein n=1 Tax=Haematococcus lacustris TaxID=44745 RepID=A0A699Z1D6_HAELA|nr:hypothetical protein HaLaN_04281 [Haematococcus lacustris]
MLSGLEAAGEEEGEGEGAEGQGNAVEVGEAVTAAPPPLPFALTMADPSSLSSNSTPSSLMDHTSSEPGLGALTNLTLSDQEELQQQPGQQEQGDSQLHEFVHRFSSASGPQTQQMFVGEGSAEGETGKADQEGLTGAAPDPGPHF